MVFSPAAAIASKEWPGDLIRAAASARTEVLQGMTAPLVLRASVRLPSMFSA